VGGFHFFSVPRGGSILEFYLGLSAPYSVHRKWRSYLDRKDQQGTVQTLSVDEMDAILDTILNHFVGFFIRLACTIGDIAKKQLFYISLFARYHGCSNYCQEVLAASGCMSTKRTFLRERTKLFARALDFVG
jgi:hypothetical protein